jgi:L-ascorbate metabolism protein UlaG (beta-lactamase superfamily)
VRIDYLGHACLRVAGDSGLAAVFDPYEPGCFGGALSLDPPAVSADLVFVSHDHADHGATGEVDGAPKTVDSAGGGGHRGVLWTGVATCHDDSGGSARGANVVFAVTFDGVTFCHLGDLGHPLSPEAAAELGKVDVLFVPVGGHFTIDAAEAVNVAGLLAPKVVVPMHFKTPKVGFPIAPVDDFIKAAPWPGEDKGSTVEFTAADLPAETTVWLMEPSR